MNITEVIKTRRSVRSFEKKKLTEEDYNAVSAYLDTITNPYELPVEFVFLDAVQYGLSSPVLSGDTLYLAGKIKQGPHSEEAFGYSFEKLVLYAWSRGIGTTWIGGTMKRELFERAAGLGEDERMYCVTPLGYPAKRMSIKEIAMRKGVKADQRMNRSELFFADDFQSPLPVQEEAIETALEMVRLAPSAVNKQPWRIVKKGTDWHFYLKHNKGFGDTGTGDLQKVDMGIALCHFMEIAGGTLSIENPMIACEADTEYIATVKR